MRITLALLAALASLPAAATPSHVPGTGVVVSYRDLDLTHDAGRATLARRIHAAAITACAESSDPECTHKAAARAYLNLDLTAIDARSRAPLEVSR